MMFSPEMLLCAFDKHAREEVLQQECQRDVSGKADGTGSPQQQSQMGHRQRRGYQVWQAKMGFQNVCIVTTMMLPWRLRDVLTYGRSAPQVVPTLIWYAALALYIVRLVVLRYQGEKAPWPFRAPQASLQEQEREMLYWIVLQAMWALLGQFRHLVCPETIFMSTSTVLLCAVHVPKYVFFAFLLPVGTCITILYHINAGCSIPLACMRCLVQTAFVVYWNNSNDGIKDSLYRSQLDMERERNTSRRERLRADALRAAFQGMLDSVFDASCICNDRGTIVSSTPHLDAILLGQGVSAAPGGLRGFELSRFGWDDSERDRVRRFLQDVANCSTARRIHVSLSRHRADPEERGSEKGIEATLSGIAMPSDAAEPGAAEVGGSQRLVFVGLQMSPGAVLEMGEPLAVDAAEGHWLLDLDVDGDAPERFLPASPATLPPGSPRTSSCGSIEHPLGSRPVLKAGTRSHLSAPTILEHCEVEFAPQDGTAAACGEEGGDCLPPATMVWVQGRCVPSTLEGVGLGQQVLCYDHLSGGLKYTEVVDVQVRPSAKPDLVTVALEDGTELEMTADHPVFPDDTPQGGAVRAADLQPSTHRLKVLKLVSIPVAGVRRVAEGALPTSLVSLSVRQPQRHSLFVAPGPASKHSVAVASASVAPAGGTLPNEQFFHRYRLRNTFIELPEESESCIDLAVRRARSAPGDCWEAPTTSELSSSMHTKATPSLCASSFGSGASYISSALSCRSSQAAQEIVVVGKGIEDRRVTGWIMSTSMQLSDVLDAKRRGLKSIGSRGHEEGWCYPCLMECWHTNKPCKFGIGCSRCHEAHTHRQFKKARNRKVRKVMGAQQGAR